MKALCDRMFAPEVVLHNLEGYGDTIKKGDLVSYQFVAERPENFTPGWHGPATVGRIFQRGDSLQIELIGPDGVGTCRVENLGSDFGNTPWRREFKIHHS